MEQQDTLPSVQAHLSVQEVLGNLLFRKNILIGVAAIVGLALLIHHYAYPSFSARTYLLIDSDRDHTGLQALLSTLGQEQGQAANNEAEMDKRLLLLRSASFFRDAASEILKKKDFETFAELLSKQGGISDSFRRLLVGMGILSAPENDVIALANTLRHMTVFSARNSHVINVAVKASDKDLAVFVVNELISFAVASFAKLEDAKLADSRKYVESKLSETISKLGKVDTEIVRFTTKNAKLSLLAPQSAISQKLLELQQEIHKTKTLYAENQQLISTFRERVKEAATEQGKEQPPAGSRADLSLGIRKTISDLQLKGEMLSVRLEALTNGLEEVLKSNLALPEQEQLLADLKRKKDLDYYVFDNLFKTLLQIEVRALSRLNQVHRLEYVTVQDILPTVGIFPKMLIGIFMSVFVTGLFIAFRQAINPMIRNKDDLKGLDASALGTVPAISTKYMTEHVARGAIFRFGIETRETIAFKRIRSRLFHLSKHSGTLPRRVISILSYQNSEGKTLVSSNIAASIAHSAKKTILVDFDLRRASLTKTHASIQMPGSCEYFDKKCDIRPMIVKDILPNLDFLPAGTFHGTIAERVTNDALRELLTLLKEDYEFVVLDTAPLMVAVESLAVAKETDFLVLVAMSGRTTLRHVKDTIEEIRSVRNTHIHYVLNKTADNPSTIRSYYYYQPMKPRLKQNTDDLDKTGFMSPGTSKRHEVTN